MIFLWLLCVSGLAHGQASSPDAPALTARWSDGTLVNAVQSEWVWLPAYPGTYEGTPALRISLRTGLSPGWKLKDTRGNEVQFQSWKDGLLVLNLLSHAGGMSLEFDTRSGARQLSLEISTSYARTFVIPHEKCANYDVSLSSEDAESHHFFIGLSCVEHDNRVTVDLVRSSDARWIEPDFEKQGLGHIRSFGFEVWKNQIRGGSDDGLGAIVRAFDGRRVRYKIEVRPLLKEEPKERIHASLNGSVATRYFSGSRKLDDRKNLAGIRADLREENKYSTFRSYLEGRYFLEDFGSFGMTENSTFDAREGFLEWYPKENLRLRAGKQIVVWGRADEINPTDVLTTKRYGLLGAEVPADYNTGAWIGQAQLSLGRLGTFEVDAIPVFLASDLYRNGTKLERISPGGSGLGAGARWDRQWGDLETGLAFFNGIDSAGNVTFQLPGHLVQDFRRIILAGTDGVITHDLYGLRWELARSWVSSKTYAVGERRGEFFGVLGLERKWNDGSGGVILQGIYKHVHDFEKATFARTSLQAVEDFSRLYHVQSTENPTALSLRPSRNFLNDTVQVDLLYAHDLSSSSFLLRPRISYSPGDNWKVVAGYEYFGGSDTGIFGLLEANELGFVEVARHF